MTIVTIVIIAIVAGIIMQSMLKKRKLGTILNSTSEKPLVIDVRSKQEYNSGHYEGARNIPHDQIESSIKKLEPWKNSPIIVYCRSGGRAGIAQSILKSQGFCNVINGGGYETIKQFCRS